METLSVRDLAEWAPTLPSVLEELGVRVRGNEEATLGYVCEEAGLDPATVLEALGDAGPAPSAEPAPVSRLELLGGRDKGGRPEPVARLVAAAGEVVALVGPTGSGKTRLLADVDALAAGDSPSGRRVLLDGSPPDDEARDTAAVRPVAWITQSMQLLLDLSVGDFVELHASTRGRGDAGELPAEVLDAACTLCGEPFGLATPLASLSGGQSRALMIADALLVSRTPILLVDEIENAGIDRARAHGLLVGQGKIVLIATHDPLFALRADRRVVLARGAMQQVLDHSGEEEAVLERLDGWDRELAGLRDALRSGRRLAT